MLISAEIAESDPNFRNCPQYRKSQLFLNYLFADPSLHPSKLATGEVLPRRFEDCLVSSRH